MASTTSTTSAKASDISGLMPLITALATAFGAWKLFEPKLERIRAIHNETGNLEPSFRLLYQLPQYILILLSTGVVVFLLLGFIYSFQPHVISTFFPITSVQAALSPSNIVWIVFALGGLGAVIYWNLISHILIIVFRLLALLPLPLLRNRFGANGESVGWHHAVVVCEGPDKGSPLIVDDNAIDRVALNVLSRIRREAGSADYAAEPTDLSNSEKANIALFGCITEANFYAHRWPSPRWSEFYAALADIQRSNPMFAPSQLLAFANGRAFFEVFRDRLDAELKARDQPSPPENGLAAAGDIVQAWDLLTRKAKGDILQLAPAIARFFGGRTVWLDHRLNQFPKLNSMGMRPQLIKLLTRWKSLPVGRGVFIQPFAKRQAWLLFHLGALRALPDIKEVTFNGTGQVAISRIAALRVIRKVAGLIERGDSAEARAVAAKLGSNHWTRLEVADFTLWSWAREAFSEAQGDAWDKNKWGWRFEDDRLWRQR